MKDLTTLDKYRIEHPMLKGADKRFYGAFKVPVGKRMFFVLATIETGDAQPLEHISVSHRNEKIVPSWAEMCAIKDMFFYPEEECVEIHPKHSEYVNMVDNCLHIWRPVNGVIFGRPWNSGEEAWSTYPDRVDEEWVRGISQQYAKYI